MNKIDKLIGRLATRSNCTGKAVISLNMGGEERLKNEIYKLIEKNKVINILRDYLSDEILINHLAEEIIELIKK
jgi:hypothetical protein